MWVCVLAYMCLYIQLKHVSLLNMFCYPGLKFVARKSPWCLFELLLYFRLEKTKEVALPHAVEEVFFQTADPWKVLFSFKSKKAPSMRLGRVQLDLSSDRYAVNTLMSTLRGLVDSQKSVQEDLITGMCLLLLLLLLLLLFFINSCIARARACMTL